MTDADLDKVSGRAYAFYVDTPSTTLGPQGTIDLKGTKQVPP